MPSVLLFNGQTDYYEVDDFTDPWKSESVDIVVFQPGIIRHTEFVYHVVPLMCKDVRFIRRDLRGHGRSSGGDAEGYQYTLDTLVDEMADFVDKVAGRPVHWIGESTAGMISIAFARKHPEKLKSLIVMASPLNLNQGEAMRKLGMIKWQSSRPVSKLGTNQKVDNTNEMGRFAGPEYLKWYDEMLLKHDVEGVAKYCDFVAGVDVSNYLEHIYVPTLIVAPTNSMASPPELNEHMAKTIKNSKLVFIDSIGHMVYIDQPEKTCSAILDWTKSLSAEN